jgi:hypothetical protein
MSAATKGERAKVASKGVAMYASMMVDVRWEVD